MPKNEKDIKEEFAREFANYLEKIHDECEEIRTKSQPFSYSILADKNPKLKIKMAKRDFVDELIQDLKSNKTLQEICKEYRDRPDYNEAMSGKMPRLKRLFNNLEKETQSLTQESILGKISPGNK